MLQNGKQILEKLTPTFAFSNNLYLKPEVTPWMLHKMCVKAFLA
jgi:hypothetical protein